MARLPDVALTIRLPGPGRGRLSERARAVVADLVFDVVVVHRWQPTGRTPCGRDVERVRCNLGRMLSEGVTCRSCRRATTRVSLLPPRPNG